MLGPCRLLTFGQFVGKMRGQVIPNVLNSNCLSQIIIAISVHDHCHGFLLNPWFCDAWHICQVCGRVAIGLPLCAPSRRPHKDRQVSLERSMFHWTRPFHPWSYRVILYFFVHKLSIDQSRSEINSSPHFWMFISHIVAGTAGINRFMLFKVSTATYHHWHLSPPTRNVRDQTQHETEDLPKPLSI